jgi:hypothetical protein
MLKLVTQSVEVDIDESDLIAPGDAARVSNRTVQGIVTLMAIGKLPTYMLPNDMRKRPQKFTSRSAVQQLTKRKAKK